MLNEPSYRPKQLAAVAKVSERTIARWCKLGIIPALQPAGEGGGMDNSYPCPKTVTTS